MIDLDGLNPQQREAVTHVTGPALVLAGAGSGKTRVITFRMAHLIDQGIPASNLLGVTFTNKAAKEMQERVAGLVAKKDARKVTLSTFHALGLRILKEDITRLGYRKGFAIVDDADRFRIVRDVLGELNLRGTRSNEANLLQIISKAKNAMSSPARLPEARYNPEMPRAQRIFDLYNQSLRNLNAVDFDDLLLLPTRLLSEYGDLRHKWRMRYRFVMVDEYQDTNPIQLQLLQQLVGAPHYNLMVVGDDDQSIYAFRGAVSDYILRFEEFFEGTKVIALEQNYRSVGTILEASNAVIAKNVKRRKKTLWSQLGAGQPIESIELPNPYEEAAYIARRIPGQAHTQGRPLHAFAILFRSNRYAQVFEQAMRDARVPYRLLGGQSVFDRKEVRDAVAYLRLLTNERDEMSLRRIVNVPTRGVGTTAQTRLAEWARQRGEPLVDALRAGSGELGDTISSRARAGLVSLFELLDGWRERLRTTPANQTRAFVEAYVKATGVPAMIRSNEKNANIARAKVRMLAELVAGVDAHEGETARSRLASWIDAVSLDPKGSSDDDDEARGRVTMMTLHSSKGLEFDVVFMVGMNEGQLPHSRALEEPGGVDEERRLCYVGMTRARQQLILSRARYVLKRNAKEPLKPSRFLADIPDRLVRNYRSTDETLTEEKQRELNAEFVAKIRRELLGEDVPDATLAQDVDLDDEADA